MPDILLGGGGGGGGGLQNYIVRTPTIAFVEKYPSMIILYTHEVVYLK